MEVLVLDKDFNTVAIVDEFESLIWTDRYYEAGDFEIYTPATEKMIDVLRQDYYLYMAESEHMMVIESLEIKSDVENGNKLIVTGRSLESILDRRIIWGNKVEGSSDPNYNYSKISFDGVTLQNGIKTLLDQNVINPTKAERKIPNFIFQESTDPHIANMKFSAQYEGENLYDSIVELCKSFKVGFKVILDESNRFIFSLYYGKDRTYNQIANPTIVFSSNFDNLINSDYIYSKVNYKTVAMIAGEEKKDGTRFSTEQAIEAGAGTGMNRREIFTNASSVTRSTTNERGRKKTLTTAEYEAQLKQKGSEDLADKIISESFEGEVNEFMYKYNVDYFMGDVVQVQNEYSAMSEPRIIEYVYSQSAGELKSYPTFGYDDYEPNQY